MPLSEKDKALLQDEHFDPRRVMVGCEAHQYYGPISNKIGVGAVKNLGEKHLSCTQCWMTYWVHDLASVPPSQRAERMEEAMEVVRNLNQMVEQGKWDYRALKRPEIIIEKDAH
jgi:hypothetical protein